MTKVWSFVIGPSLRHSGLVIGHSRLLVLLLLAGLIGGCAQPITISGWQGSVEKYIDTIGQGDPNVLRDVSWPRSARSFSVIEAGEPLKSQDANGLLVAAPQIGDRRWYVFVVGIVNKRVVQDVRIAALSVSDSGQRIWRTSSVDRQAVLAYRSYKEKLWHERFPERGGPPAAQYTVFPQEDDVFVVALQGGRVAVLHQPSGAQWELEIAPSGSSPPEGPPPPARSGGVIAASRAISPPARSEPAPVPAAVSPNRAL